LIAPRAFRRGLRAAEVAALVLAAGLLPSLAASAQEGDAPTLAGYSLRARGAAIYQSYNQQSIPIPAVPTEELSVAHSEAELANGSAHGVASLAWPGNTAANAPSALYDLGYPRQLPAPPNYPVRAESFFPAGEGQSEEGSLDAGAVTMRSASSDTSSTASAQSADVEGVASTGTVSSSAKTVAEGGLATSEARAAVTGFELLGGIVKIEQVRSVATAETDGVKGTVTGRTVVTGLTIQDVEFTVDHDGVHAAGEAIPFPGGTDPINEQLALAGLSLFIAEPLDVVEGAEASRSIGGLIIVLETKTLADNLPPDLFSQLPPEVPPFLYDSNRTLTISLGGVAVSATAGGVLPPPPPPTTPPPPDTGAGGTEVPPGPVVEPPPPEVPPAPGSTPASSDEPPAGGTLPIALAVFGSLGIVATSRALRRVADKALLDAPAAAACIIAETT
jgi:hypothetical protein